MVNTPFVIPGSYPYMIHACPLSEKDFPYPTHTHGLTEIGWPEFFIDPLSFGGEGNAQRINASYEYFSKPENSHKLKNILRGHIEHLTAMDLIGKPDPRPYVYSYRRVEPTFEAVKLAYGAGVIGVFPPMRFIQIWVDGDDFALTDEYYRGGVKPH